MDVTIKITTSEDRAALDRLAALDSSRALPGDYLAAEVDGTLVAAVPLDGGAPIADPFRPTAEVVALLLLRAAQLRGERGGRRLRPAGRRPAAAPA